MLIEQLDKRQGVAESSSVKFEISHEDELIQTFHFKADTYYMSCNQHCFIKSCVRFSMSIVPGMKDTFFWWLNSWTRCRRSHTRATHLSLSAIVNSLRYTLFNIFQFHDRVPVSRNNEYLCHAHALSWYDIRISWFIVFFCRLKHVPRIWTWRIKKQTTFGH